MKWLNDYRIRLVLFVFVVAIVLSSGRAKADFTIGEPMNLGPTLNSSSSEWAPSISADGLSLYFCSNRSGGYGGRDIWVSTRSTVFDSWCAPVNLGSVVNGPAKDALPSISADGLSLFFESTRSGGYGGHDIWVTTRATVDDDWSEPVNLGEAVNSSYHDATPYISADGLSLFFESMRSGGSGHFDLWVTTRPTVSEPWGTPVNLGPTVNSSAWDGIPCISADGLVLFFISGDNPDICVTTRETIHEDWSTPVNLGLTVNTSALHDPGSISSDGRLLFFASSRPGGYGRSDMWQVPIIPIVDFNGDEIVDSKDMSIMVDYWGTDEPLCDISPTPWGDGIVDVQDLIVLSEHLFEDYRLMAHWKFDETEGSIAHDIIDVNDGICHGEPVWQPNSGMIGGALLFDGIDDYVDTPFILNPGKVSFSIFAWINGGAPGQVVVSQADTTIDTPVGQSTNPGGMWLATYSTDGRLMTGLMDTVFGSLDSESVVTDGQWHHVGLVYDRTALKRHLFVDRVEVAVDSDYVAGEQMTGGLYIGAGNDLNATTFFSGLIDDVRIYNVALTAEEVADLAK